MKGFLNLLARANLVELSDEEKAAAGIDIPDIVAPAEAFEPPVEPEPPPLQNLPPSASGLEEERPVAEIYAAAGMSPSPFPAEKLLRLLDGLRTMDATTRKAAVLAMDAADDNWQISDCIADAERKIAALNAYKQHLAGQLRGTEQQSVEHIGAIKSDLENSSTEIRKQISELEQLLEREITKTAQETTNLESGVRAAREMVGRETRRIDSEIERLREIPTQFKVEKTDIEER